MNFPVKQFFPFPLKKVEQTDLLSRLKTFEFPAGKKVLSQGETAPYIYFLEQGIFKSYLQTKDKYWVQAFHLPHQVGGAWESFLSQQASFTNLESLSQSRGWKMHRSDWEILLHHYKDFERWVRLKTQALYQAELAFQRNKIVMDARERLEKFEQDYAPYLSLIPKADIQSYLST